MTIIINLDKVNEIIEQNKAFNYTPSRYEIAGTYMQKVLTGNERIELSNQVNTKSFTQRIRLATNLLANMIDEAKRNS